MANITAEQKAAIVRLISDSSQLMGGDSYVATKCGISGATISLMKSNQYITKGDDMWLRVGAALGWKPGGYQIADTTNLKAGLSILADAQQNSLYLRVAEKAGSGKTTFINKYIASDNTANVFYFECCDSINKCDFLPELARNLGISQPTARQSQRQVLNAIITFFETRKGKPLLILDQANSLRPSTYSYLISMYNRLKYRLGIVMVGTESLLTDFQRGLKSNRKSYDEVDSRWGRSFLPLPGNSIHDTRRICKANGIENQAVADDIFRSCRPVQKTIQHDGQPVTITVVEDGRLIERAIIKHHLLTAPQA